MEGSYGVNRNLDNVKGQTCLNDQHSSGTKGFSRRALDSVPPARAEETRRPSSWPPRRCSRATSPRRRSLCSAGDDAAASFRLGSPTCRVRSAHTCGTHGRGGEGREEAHGRAPQPGDGKQLVSVRCRSEMLMLLGLRDILDLRQGLEIE